VKGKVVTILGGGKSALDAAVWAATGEAAEVHLIMRSMHWAAPRYIGNESPDKGEWNQNVLYSRISQSFLATCRGCYFPVGNIPLSSWLLHDTAIGQWLRNTFWGLVTGDIIKQYQFPEWLVPPRPFLHDAIYLSVLSPNLVEMMTNGQIQPHLCKTIGRLEQRRVHLATIDGCTPHADTPASPEAIETDVLIVGTGFSSSVVPILSDEIKGKLFDGDGNIQLLRAAHNPDLPGMGFVGFKLNVNSMLSSALSARWIAEYAKGAEGAISRNGVLSDKDEVWRQIKAGIDFESKMAALQPGARSRVGDGGMFQGSSIYPFADAVMTDLGLDPYRSRTWIEEFTAPQLNTLYAGLGEELADPETHAAKDYTLHFAFFFSVVLGLLLLLLYLFFLAARCCLARCGKIVDRKSKEE